MVDETGDFLRAGAPFLYLAAHTQSHGWGDAVMITLLWIFQFSHLLVEDKTLLWMITSFPFSVGHTAGDDPADGKKRQMAISVKFQCLQQPFC